MWNTAIKTHSTLKNNNIKKTNLKRFEQLHWKSTGGFKFLHKVLPECIVSKGISNTESIHTEYRIFRVENQSLICQSASEYGTCLCNTSTNEVCTTICKMDFWFLFYIYVLLWYGICLTVMTSLLHFYKYFHNTVFFF